jgi:oligosaccharyltransferase complex subunit epsilon
MVRSTTKDAQDLIRALWSAYSATPTNLKVVPLFSSAFVQKSLLFPNPALVHHLDN